jgi:signal transduction histidine kinase
LNLFVNAEEAAASNLLVRISQEGDAGVISVEDNAVSAKADTNAANLASLGIGLEVSTWLAEKNGGSLSRESLPAGGSRAILHLPAAP